MPRSTLVPVRRRRAVLATTTLAAAVLAAAGGLAGCARTLDAAAPPTPAEVHPRWPGCAATGAFDDDRHDSGGRPGRGSVPDGFRPVAAVVCALDRRTDGGGEVVRSERELRADDIAALLTYLARPSQVSSDPQDLVCPAMGVTPLWLFLVDAHGRWITPAAPTDPCGFALDTFREPGPAYEQLDFHVVVAR